MKKTHLILISALIFIMLCGCGEDTDNEKDTDDQSVVTESSSSVSEDNSGIRPVSSSLTTPLGIDEWGSAAKFSVSMQKYYPVPVRITSVIKGKDAAAKVKQFMDSSDEYDYKKPEDDYEWICAEYEMELNDFPTDEGGTDVSITSFVTDKDGKSIEYDGKIISVTTINMTDDSYYYDGTHKGLRAYTLPEKYSDQILILGEYNETQAFFE